MQGRAQAAAVGLAIAMGAIAGDARAHVAVASVGANGGSHCVAAIATAPDSHLALYALDVVTFNALTPGELRDSYDVLLFTNDTDPSLMADWATRIAPFLARGGGVVFEDAANLDDLGAIATAGSCNAGPFAVTAQV